MKKFCSRVVASVKSAKLVLAMVCVACALLLSGCYVDSGWSPSPPYGWNNTFYDQSLNGYWQLVQINGATVTGYDVNFLYFNGGGRGKYYYYSDGRRMWENTAYWCQEAVSGNSYYQINLQYETSGSPTTMNYWFAGGGNTLYLQWKSYNGVQTYVYSAVRGAPW